MSDWPGSFKPSHVEATERLTRELRTSESRRWRELRDHLRRAALEAQDVAVAKLFQDDVAMDYGVLVAKDGRVFEFDTEYEQDSAGRVLGPEEAPVREFTEVDSAEPPWAEEVAVAQAYLGHEKGPKKG